MAGLGEIGNTLYTASYRQGASFLYTVNTANGSISSIGSATTTQYDDMGSTLTGLYAVGADSQLYSLNPLTGAATLIGPTGLTLSGARTLSTNSSTLYFTNPSGLYTVNTTIGLATLVGPFGGGRQIGGLVLLGSILYGGESSPVSGDRYH